MLFVIYLTCSIGEGVYWSHMYINIYVENLVSFYYVSYCIVIECFEKGIYKIYMKITKKYPYDHNF